MGCGRLKGKVALITGAAQGIGAATARLFAQEGAIVVISDVKDDLGSALAKEIGQGSVYFHQDVSDEKQWEQLIADIVKKFGHLDILVNNAGIMGVGPQYGPQDPEHASLESWRKVQAINTEGVFLGCKYAIRAMKKAGGAIVNVSSRSGIVGVPSAAAYAASKAAVRNHTKSVALYCCEQGYPIRCNSIHPASILTPLWDPMFGERASDRAASIEKMAATIPMHRMGTPEEVAYVILLLASAESGFMTGSEVTVDGGILAGSASSPKLYTEK